MLDVPQEPIPTWLLLARFCKLCINRRARRIVTACMKDF